LWNVLTNAVKFTPKHGNISVSARQRDGKVEISVDDTGIGIAAEALVRVFEPFWQSSSVAQAGLRGARRRSR
jgi:two-component system cell cycle sensor histidine kinase PleC